MLIMGIFAESWIGYNHIRAKLRQRKHKKIVGESAAGDVTKQLKKDSFFFFFYQKKRKIEKKIGFLNQVLRCYKLGMRI